MGPAIAAVWGIVVTAARTSSSDTAHAGIVLALGLAVGSTMVWLAARVLRQLLVALWRWATARDIPDDRYAP